MSGMELFKIIQLVMKCQKTGKKVNITLSSGDKVSGAITEYTGEKLLLSVNDGDNIEIKLQNISFIEEERIDLSSFMLQRVELIQVSGKMLDAVVISVDEEKLTLVNEEGQVEVEINSIASISAGDNKVILNDTLQIEGDEKQVAIVEEAFEEPKEEVAKQQSITSVEEIAELLKDYPKGTNAFTDKLKELLFHIPEDDHELYIEMWNKYSVYLKRTQKYCDIYILRPVLGQQGLYQIHLKMR